MRYIILILFFTTQLLKGQAIELNQIAGSKKQGTYPRATIPVVVDDTTKYLLQYDSVAWADIKNKPSTSGGVTTVTATAPITSTGGAAPNIAIPQSGSTTNGYLSSTDWNTFNSKDPSSTNELQTLSYSHPVATLTPSGGNFTIPATTAYWNANKLQGVNISTTTPLSDNILSYNAAGAAWGPVSSNAIISNITSLTPQYLVYGGGTGNLGQSPNLYWNGNLNVNAALLQSTGAGALYMLHQLSGSDRYFEGIGSQVGQTSSDWGHYNYTGKTFWSNAGGVIFTLNANRNVGIGMINPLQKLHVGGNGRFDALSTSGSAPTTTGTTRFVITDSNGDLSYTTESDGVIGNEVTGADGNGIATTGSGTSGSPYRVTLSGKVKPLADIAGANSGFGTSGQVLTTNGSSSSPVYTWTSAGSGTVTSVAAGQGMFALTSNPITSTGTVHSLGPEYGINGIGGSTATIAVTANTWNTVSFTIGTVGGLFNSMTVNNTTKEITITPGLYHIEYSLGFNTDATTQNSARLVIGSTAQASTERRQNSIANNDYTIAGGAIINTTSTNAIVYLQFKSAAAANVSYMTPNITIRRLN